MTRPANKITKTPRLKAVALPQALADRLAHLAQLPEDWDSYGGLPISPKVRMGVKV